jgi:hypothetical protein
LKPGDCSEGVTLVEGEARGEPLWIIALRDGPILFESSA